MEKETVIISKEEFEKMADAFTFLSYLEAHGVDNWEGYAEAKESMERDK